MYIMSKSVTVSPDFEVKADEQHVAKENRSTKASLYAVHAEFVFSYLLLLRVTRTTLIFIVCIRFCHESTIFNTQFQVCAYISIKEGIIAV